MTPLLKHDTLTAVSPFNRSVPLVLAALILTQCQGSKQATPGAVVVGAELGVVQAQLIMLQLAGSNELPGAPLGVYVADYLVDSTGIYVRGAVNGVNAGQGIFVEDQDQSEESFATLQELGVVLQVDVPDMLNRSTDRQQTLDTYLDTLTQTLTKSKTQVTALKQKQKLLLSAQHDKRLVVTKVQHDLNLALQKQDYTTASAKQSEIVTAKADQAKAESEVTQINSTINLYTNLNKVADRRVLAIQSNREVLIAGLKVVDVPGIEELDVYTKGRATRTTTTPR